MREIYIDISKDSGDSITTIQGNNNNKVYKLIVTDNNKRLDLTGKSVKMAYVNNNGDGDIIEGLQITNAVQGEISLSITNVLTKQDGNYGCQLAIYNSSGFLEHTGSFSLIVKENLFNRVSGGLLKTTTYQKLISILEKSEEMVVNLHDAKEVNSSLSNNINSGTNLNTNLSNNIRDGNSLNAALTQNKQDAAVKNTELNKSLEETKKYIDGLDGSQNIPQIRMDVTELQNGLKSNQSLEYQGYNVTCNNTLEGRTEGMEIRGRTLQNLFDVNRADSNTINSPSDITYRMGLESGRKYVFGFNIKTVTGENVQGYFCRVEFTDGTYKNTFDTFEKSQTPFNDLKGYHEVIVQIPSDKTVKKVTSWIRGYQQGQSVTFENCMCIEGENIPCSYFKGIKSVGEAEINLLEESQIVDGYITKEGSQYKFITGSNTSTAIIPCDPNTTYTIVKENPTDRFAVGVRDSPIENGNTIDILKELYTTSSVITVTTPSYARYLAVYLTKNITNEPVGKVGIYKSVNSFQWSPYNKAKISILSHGRNMVEFLEVGGIYGSNGGDYNSKAYLRSNYMNLVDIDSLGIVNNIDDVDISTNLIYFYDINKNGINYKSLGGNATVNVPKGTAYCRVELKSLSAVDISSKVNRQKLMVAKGIRTETPYELYKSDKKEILLNQPLRGLSENVFDRIFERDGKVVLEQNIGRSIFDGSSDENWKKYSVIQADGYFTAILEKQNAVQTYIVSNNFMYNERTWAGDFYNEGIQMSHTNSEPHLFIKISNSKLETQDIEGFKKWLQQNPTTVYYQLATPIITELPIKDLDLSVFQDVTHIMSTNSIPSTLDFKIPTNYGSVLQQQSKNINDLYKLIDEILVPQVASNTLDIELLKNK